MRDLILQKPVGMRPNHREFTRWNHGDVDNVFLRIEKPSGRAKG